MITSDALLSILLFTAAHSLTTDDLLNYDWGAKNCNCKVGKADRHLDFLPSRAKEPPSVSGVVFIEMPRRKNDLFPQQHKFSSDSGVLEISPTGNRLELPIERDLFKISDNSLGNIKEGSIGMNETAILNVAGFSSLQLINSRLLLGSMATFTVKEHSIMKANLASLYLADDAKFAADYLTRVEMSHENDLQFEMPALTMTWGTEIMLKEHSQISSEQGHITLHPIAYIELMDRSKISLSRKEKSLSATEEPGLTLMERGRLVLRKGSLLDIQRGSHLFIAKGISVELTSSAIFVQPFSSDIQLWCAIQRSLNLQNKFLRLDGSQATDEKDEGIACEQSAEKLAERVMTDSDNQQLDLHLQILDTKAANPLNNKLHVDPELPPSFDAVDCANYP